MRSGPASRWTSRLAAASILLLTLASPAARGRDYCDGAQAVLNDVARDLEVYRIKFGRCASGDLTMAQLYKDLGRTSQPPLDPWDRGYLFRATSDGCLEAFSLGADGRRDTNDDLSLRAIPGACKAEGCLDFP